jgi:predicted Fe-Mo cluster-binding NifX family protein
MQYRGCHYQINSRITYYNNYIINKNTPVAQTMLFPRIKSLLNVKRGNNTMKIAIPVFHTKISPRFDQAQGFVLLETENGSIIARKTLTTKGWSVLDKMKHLVSLEVNTLICGGIDRASLQYLGFKGIKIYSWVTGEVEDAVSCFLSHRMRPGIILGKHGTMIGRWQFCRGRNHLCNMFQTNFNKGNKGGADDAQR